MSKMKLVIDLAGAPKDAEVTISDISSKPSWYV